MSRVFDTEPWFLSIELSGNINGGTDNWSRLDACVRCGKGKGTHTQNGLAES